MIFLAGIVVGFVIGAFATLVMAWHFGHPNVQAPVGSTSWKGPAL